MLSSDVDVFVKYIILRNLTEFPSIVPSDGVAHVILYLTSPFYFRNP